MESECRVRIHWPCHAILTCSCLRGSGDLRFTMDSVRGVRIHCACGAIMKCKKLSASKFLFFFLCCCFCGVFTAPSVLQWILTCRYLAGHGALKNTMDSELRCRIASVYEAIMSRYNLAGHDPLENTMVFERRSRIASVY